jgi:hypothetical protein
MHGARVDQEGRLWVPWQAVVKVWIVSMLYGCLA